MSTYWYFECLDHDPPIQSEDEFTQHTDDYPFREGVRLALSRPVPEDWWDRKTLADNYFTAHACRFLANHPTCSLGLLNEYGERRPLSADSSNGASDLNATALDSSSASSVVGSSDAD